MQNSFMHGETA